MNFSTNKKVQQLLRLEKGVLLSQKIARVCLNIVVLMKVLEKLINKAESSRPHSFVMRTFDKLYFLLHRFCNTAGSIYYTILHILYYYIAIYYIIVRDAQDTQKNKHY